MKLMAKGIKDSSKAVIQSVRTLADTMGDAFAGLAIPEISAGQLALAGRSILLSVAVNGYNDKNDNDLADTVVQRIKEMLNEDDSVWGR